MEPYAICQGASLICSHFRIAPATTIYPRITTNGLIMLFCGLLSSRLVFPPSISKALRLTNSSERDRILGVLCYSEFQLKDCPCYVMMYVVQSLSSSSFTLIKESPRSHLLQAKRLSFDPVNQRNRNQDTISSRYTCCTSTY
jgi:hypothetical protein